MEVEADVCLRVSGRVGWGGGWGGVSEMEIRRNEQRACSRRRRPAVPSAPRKPAAAFVCASVFVSVTRADAAPCPRAQPLCCWRPLTLTKP